MTDNRTQVVACIECHTLQTHRVCTPCYMADVVLDNLVPGDWDLCVWLDGNYVIGRVDAADRKQLVRTILKAASNPRQPPTESKPAPPQPPVAGVRTMGLLESDTLR